MEMLLRINLLETHSEICLTRVHCRNGSGCGIVQEEPKIAHQAQNGGSYQGKRKQKPTGRNRLWLIPIQL